MLKKKVLPWLTPSDMAVMRPSQRSTIYLTMRRPIPLPDELWSAVLNFLPNYLNKLGSWFWEMPMPLSLTQTNKVSVASSKLTEILIEPLLVYWSAFFARLTSTCSNRR